MGKYNRRPKLRSVERNRARKTGVRRRRVYADSTDYGAFTEAGNAPERNHWNWRRIALIAFGLLLILFGTVAYASQHGKDEVPASEAPAPAEAVDATIAGPAAEEEMPEPVIIEEPAPVEAAEPAVADVLSQDKLEKKIVRIPE